MKLKDFIVNTLGSTTELDEEVFIVTYAGTDTCSLLSKDVVIQQCNECLTDNHDASAGTVKDLQQAIKILNKFDVKVYELD